MSQLPSTQALTPGADLWVIGSSAESPWALRLDWALNFQILRASKYRPRELSSELQTVLEETGLKTWTQGPQNKQNEPLLIPADLNLPCRWVLSLNNWDLATLKKTLEGLGSPSLRVFLPRAVGPDTFVKQWTETMGERDFQLVID
ncbi:MAG: hypothetical protein ACK5P7_07485 [Bdellovibrio sp.]